MQDAKQLLFKSWDLFIRDAVNAIHWQRPFTHTYGFLASSDIKDSGVYYLREHGIQFGLDLQDHRLD